MKPYVYIFSDRLNFTWNLKPLFNKLRQRKEEFDVSMWCLKNKRLFGPGGNTRGIPHSPPLQRKPDVIVTNHAWWDEGYHVCLWAQKARVPVVAIEHGCTMFFQSQAKYRRTIGKARVKCLWSDHNLEIMRKYNPDHHKRCVVTGPPRYDELYDFQARADLDLPKDFVLVLSTWSVQKDSPRHAANKIAEKYNVVLKTHPNEHHYPGRSPGRIVGKKVHISSGQEELFTLLKRCRAVVTPISSAMLPAMLFRKPIYIVSVPQKGMGILEFRKEHGHLFNWGIEDLMENNTGVLSSDFQHFGGQNDGMNCERIVKVIRSVL